MLFQLTMFPTDMHGEGISKSAAVARVIDIIEKSSLPYKMGPMSTTIEGEWDEVIAVIDKARRMLRNKHSRVYISITIDDRENSGSRLTGKIESVEKKLGRQVKK